MNRQQFLMTVVLLFVGSVGPPGLALAAEVEDGCGDGGGGSADIQTLSASFDEATGLISVQMTLCAEADAQTKYRLHFDHTEPFATDPDRNGDGFINDGDFCVTTSDDGMQHKDHKDTGPGAITVDGKVLTYSVHKADLNPELMVGDTIFVWADTHDKGTLDTAPDTNGIDGCTKPEESGEVVELRLQDEALCPCAFDVPFDAWPARTLLLCDPVLVQQTFLAGFGDPGAPSTEAIGTTGDVPQDFAMSCATTVDNIVLEFNQPISSAEFQQCSADIISYAIALNDHFGGNFVDFSLCPQ